MRRKYREKSIGLTKGLPYAHTEFNIQKSPFRALPNPLVCEYSEVLMSKIVQNQIAKKFWLVRFLHSYTSLPTLFCEPPFEERLFAPVFDAVRFFFGLFHPLFCLLCLNLLVSLQCFFSSFFSFLRLFGLSVKMLLLHFLH